MISDYIGGVSKYFDIRPRLRVTSPVTAANSPYQAKVGELVVLDTSDGDVEVLLPEITPGNTDEIIAFSFYPLGAGNGVDVLPFGDQTMNGLPADPPPGFSGSTDLAAAIISDGVSNWLTLWYSPLPA